MNEYIRNHSKLRYHALYLMPSLGSVWSGCKINLSQLKSALSRWMTTPVNAPAYTMLFVETCESSVFDATYLLVDVHHFCLLIHIGICRKAKKVSPKRYAHNFMEFVWIAHCFKKAWNEGKQLPACKWKKQVLSSTHVWPPTKQDTKALFQSRAFAEL